MAAETNTEAGSGSGRAESCAMSAEDFVKIGCSDGHCVGLTTAGVSTRWTPPCVSGAAAATRVLSGLAGLRLLHSPL